MVVLPVSIVVLPVSMVLLIDFWEINFWCHTTEFCSNRNVFRMLDQLHPFATVFDNTKSCNDGNVTWTSFSGLSIWCRVHFSWDPLHCNKWLKPDMRQVFINLSETWTHTGGFRCALCWTCWPPRTRHDAGLQSALCKLCLMKLVLPVPTADIVLGLSVRFATFFVLEAGFLVK